MIENMIPFKVKALPLGAINMVYFEKFRPVPDIKNENILLDRVWIVAAVSGSCFLLVREGEVPAWWPEEYCEVVETPKVKF